MIGDVGFFDDYGSNMDIFLLWDKCRKEKRDTSIVFPRFKRLKRIVCELSQSEQPESWYTSLSFYPQNDSRSCADSASATQWTQEMDSLLGSETDTDIAHKLGLSCTIVSLRRNKLGIPKFDLKSHNWTTIDAMLGTDIDSAIATRFGVCKTSVYKRRRELGIPAAKVVREWTQDMDLLLGTDIDSVIACAINVPSATVAARRIALGIPRFDRKGKKRQVAFSE